MSYEITESWNPVVGCLHGCSYCWARRMAIRLALMGIEPYRSSKFEPKLVERRLNKNFRKGSFVFVCDMADLFGSWVPSEWIVSVLKRVRLNWQARFFFLTKNPSRYLEFKELFGSNTVLATTIESNRHYPHLSKAPPPMQRMDAMLRLNHKEKAVVIEPILEFDEDEFLEMLKAIEPRFVYIGYDNWGCNLPEPPLSKTRRLVERLEGFTEVRTGSLRDRKGSFKYGLVNRQLW